MTLRDTNLHTNILASRELEPIDRLWTYWNSLRTDGPVPKRSAVKPLELGALLDYAFVVEHNPFCGAKFRVVGTSVTDLLGIDVRGMPVGALLTPSVRSRFVDPLKSVFQGPSTLTARFISSAENSNDVVTSSAMFLPMANESGDVTCALGCWVTDGALGAAPRHFDVLDSVECDPLKHCLKKQKAAPELERPYLQVVS